MRTWVLLIRGINVGGKNVLPMGELVDELRSAIERNPFPEAEAEPKTLHLFFLEAPPVTPDTEALTSARSPAERFKIDGRVLYLHAPEGIGRSRLAAQAERHLGVTATARNWRTVTKLSELADT